VLTGFVNSRETEERLVVKIREISGAKSEKSLLKLEEKNQVVSGNTLITELTAAKVPAVKSKS
jgi:hypothetical protein